MRNKYGVKHIRSNEVFTMAGFTSKSKATLMARRMQAGSRRTLPKRLTKFKVVRVR